MGLGQRPPSPIRTLVIVARDHPEVVNRLRAQYGPETTTILIDRRHAERRQSAPIPTLRDRRRGERRRPLTTSDEALWEMAHFRFVYLMGA